MTARKRREPAPVELANLPEIPDGFSVLTPTEERRERELEEILEQLGSDARIKVWQTIDGRSSYAGDMSADGFTLDALLEAFGGGDKTLHIIQGRTREKVNISLDPSVPPKNPRAPKAAATSGGAADMSTMFALMAKTSMDQASNMNTMMMGIVSALTSIMGATNRTDPVAQAVQIATVLKGNGNNGGATEMLGLIREGMKIGEAMGGGKDDDDGVMGVVSKGMDTLGVLINGIVEERKTKAAGQATGQATGQVTGQLAPGPTLDAVAPFIQPGTMPNESVASVRSWVDAARPNIGQLLAASRFLSPPLAANAIAEMLSDDQFFDLIDDVRNQDDGGFGARLKTYFPREVETVDPHWLGEVLRVLLTEHVDDDDGGDGDDAPAVAPSPEDN